MSNVTLHAFNLLRLHFHCTTVIKFRKLRWSRTRGGAAGCSSYIKEATARPVCKHNAPCVFPLYSNISTFFLRDFLRFSHQRRCCMCALAPPRQRFGSTRANDCAGRSDRLAGVQCTSCEPPYYSLHPWNSFHYLGDACGHRNATHICDKEMRDAATWTLVKLVRCCQSLISIEYSFPKWGELLAPMVSAHFRRSLPRANFKSLVSSLSRAAPSRLSRLTSFGSA